MTRRSADATRALLFHAASRIIAAQGMGRLTLDEVAKQAGVSKGGLLYHFPSKEALIEGLIHELIEQFDGQIEHEIAADTDPDARGRYTRAYVRASFRDDPNDLSLYTGLAAALDANPALLGRFHSISGRWRARLLADGIAPEVALGAALAADGLVFNELLEPHDKDTGLRAGTLAALIAWVNNARL
jgi:AcrR family transcriptional regulator